MLSPAVLQTSGSNIIGQSNRNLRGRLREHLNYIDKNTEATGNHFNLPGHSKWDLMTTVVEKVHARKVWVSITY